MEGGTGEVQDDVGGELFLQQWRERRHTNNPSCDQQQLAAANSPHLHPHRYTLPNASPVASNTPTSNHTASSHAHRASYSQHRPSAIRASHPPHPTHLTHLTTTSIIIAASTSVSAVVAQQRHVHAA